jgi:hypothetical protein
VVLFILLVSIHSCCPFVTTTVHGLVVVLLNSMFQMLVVDLFQQLIRLFYSIVVVLDPQQLCQFDSGAPFRQQLVSSV